MAQIVAAIFFAFFNGMVTALLDGPLWGCYAVSILTMHIFLSK